MKIYHHWLTRFAESAVCKNRVKSGGSPLRFSETRNHLGKQVVADGSKRHQSKRCVIRSYEQHRNKGLALPMGPLTFDHPLIDGAIADQFMAKVKAFIDAGQFTL